MKKIENITLEELITLDKEYQVLTQDELNYKKINNLLGSINLIGGLSLPLFLEHFYKNPNIINFSLTGLSCINCVIITDNIIKNIKNKIPFSIIKDYHSYRNELPIGKELNRLYNNFLEDLLNEIKESPFDKDPLSLAILVGDYLIPQGLLSYTNHFHKIPTPEQWLTISSINDNFYYNLPEGLFVLAGYGCCRHYNSFICDLFTKMKIKNDKICCIRTDFNKLKLREAEFNFNMNHLITGYLENNTYHMIDSYNGSYTLIQKESCYYDSENFDCIIPDFTNNLFNQQNLHYSPDIPYSNLKLEEIQKKKNKIEELLYNENEIERFYNFKTNHFENIKKIAYLTQLESERSPEKENKKSKRI